MQTLDNRCALAFSYHFKLDKQRKTPWSEKKLMALSMVLEEPVAEYSRPLEALGWSALERRNGLIVCQRHWHHLHSGPTRAFVHAQAASSVLNHSDRRFLDQRAKIAEKKHSNVPITVINVFTMVVNDVVYLGSLCSQVSWLYKSEFKCTYFIRYTLLYLKSTLFSTILFSPQKWFAQLCCLSIFGPFSVNYINILRCKKYK